MKSKFNTLLNKKEIKKLINWFINNHGPIKSSKLLEKLKNLGFKIATESGISIGINDLKIPESKQNLFSNNYKELNKIKIKKSKGKLNSFEYNEKSNEIWNKTNEILKEEIIKNYKETDPLNPVYIMVTSGARGNISQIRQLIGMRGLMSDNEGRIINNIIKNSLKEGLNIPEYFTSCYGARKGLIDTALKTANSGYLTRKLIYAVQNQIIKQPNCATKRHFLLLNSKKSKHYYKITSEKLIGRVLAKDIHINGKRIEAGQDICKYISNKIIIIKKIFIRTPLLCKLNIGICQLCYGWNLGNGRLVELGESVGILAAQSISEPGTQLTMRTFHTGGAFTDTIAETILCNTNGKIIYDSKKFGIELNTYNNERIFFTTKSKKILIFKDKINKRIINLPKYSILFTKNKEEVFNKQVIAEKSNNKVLNKKIFNSSEKKYVKTEISGKSEINLFEDKQGKRSKKLNIITGNVINYSKIVKNIYLKKKYSIQMKEEIKRNNYKQIFEIESELLKKKYSIKRKNLKTIINNSINKTENTYTIKIKDKDQILINKKRTTLTIKSDKNEKSGKFLEKNKRIKINYKNIWPTKIEEKRKKKLSIEKNNNHNIPVNCKTTIKNNQIIKKSTTILIYKTKNKKTKDITQGLNKVEEILENKHQIKNKINNKILKRLKKARKILNWKSAVDKTISKIQVFLIKKLQNIYSSQNVNIADKHFEIIIKEMTSKIIIIKNGESKLICGELVERKKIEKINKNLNKKITYKPIIIGIKKIPKYNAGFIAASSFEETTKILTQAAIEGKIDWLYGLKENIIFANIIPIGTGLGI
uniref:DNA-directed RNA polymerase n=1 Tax=Trachelomonas grandis TaxID=215769 RepID=A0A385ULI5_9EUGL|nr:RNA polymerase beta'' subunit [Trachelomonas grandis]